MCGIAGLWSLDTRIGREECSAAARRMTRSLTHRGPDDEGYFEQPEAGVYLGHRRLSIVDLSKEGHQPMHSPSGRYVIVFNGEIYNHRRLRPELEQCGYTFRGHSDTEVLLAGIEHWGLLATVERSIGMFAYALWDRRDRELTLVRDRLGIKPLYYGWVGGHLVFGSELKALRQAPGFSNRIHRDVIASFLRNNYIPDPWSIYEGIYKLMPGTWVKFDSATVQRQRTPDELTSRTTVYWSAREVAERGSGNPIAADAHDATEKLKELLSDAIGLRMEADVPLGAFLSGGVDSSTVVALMQAQSMRPVRTFTIGFHEAGFDEAPHAQSVAKHLGTDHTQMYVTAREAMDVIPELAAMYDEPFSDVSEIPTYLVSEIARRHVTVSLSGDGGDELFGGYSRYFVAERLWDQLRRLPYPVRRAVARCLRAAPALCSLLLRVVGFVAPHRWPLNNPRDKIGRMSELLNANTPSELYKLLMSHWSEPGRLLSNVSEPLTTLTDPTLQANVRENIERMMYTDLVSYLPGDILTKLDRASMAVGLEARVPLLDHRVVEFAWQLPLNLKTKSGEGKRILRQILYEHVPRAMIDRPKQGFGVPVGDWLRGPLRDWAEGLLDQRRLEAEGYLDPATVRTLWSTHLSGRIDEQYRLWDILMFESWLEGQAGSNKRHVDPAMNEFAPLGSITGSPIGAGPPRTVTAQASLD